MTAVRDADPFFPGPPVGNREFRRLPSAYELHLRARRARSKAIGVLSLHTMSKFADWLYMLAFNGGVSLARRLAAERRLRGDIRMLRQLQDRDLSDMGLGRSEIEHVVRGGRSRTTESPLHRRTSAQRQDAA